MYDYLEGQIPSHGCTFEADEAGKCQFSLDDVF